MATTPQVAQAAADDKRQQRILARAAELRDAAQADYDQVVAGQADETSAHIASLDELDAVATSAMATADGAREVLDATRAAYAHAQAAMDDANAHVQAIAAERAASTADHVAFLQSSNERITTLRPLLEPDYWVELATKEIDASIAEGG